METDKQKNDILRGSAVKFVVLMGVISLFADMTYEAARSITGPFLGILGASAVTVGFVAGLGELVGYTLRIVSGYLSDKTKSYWTMTFVGYAINLLAVPLMALAGHWWIAASLIVAERFGKAIRVPARDAMLSHATERTGQGWGFGLHEALDQIGALLGPLVVAAVLYFRGSYRMGFAVLLIPAVLALLTLAIARFLYPNPRDLEVKRIIIEDKKLPKAFWVYLAGAALIGAGYADFPLIAYHFQKTGLLPDVWIPIFYSIAMGVDAIAALVLGRLFDKIGLRAMAIAALLSAFFAPLVFLGGFYAMLVGVMIWGIGMGAQESIMRAAVATMVAPDRRGSAFGIFSSGYGLFWFAGSIVMGFLYDVSIPGLIIFSMALQFISIPVFLRVNRIPVQG